jgi:Domain of unknown function (DUF5659)
MHNMMEQYNTVDIVLASYLMLCGISLVKIEKTANKGVFYFQDVPQELIIEYDLGKAKVEPAAFNNMVKFLTTSVRRSNVKTI